ncbi:DUF1566 domain-containing protein [Hahella aquimaris]|uniref:Lcl C-terminal domain-containing protein n=1 Tax=Hahella sp. HNIBRBA332 TaxID=3015983 RepID=UPI00273B3FBA|nr:DUF1566 domain-containing protein [Hahella sp. HNIBRBA332]WLQ16139.1 DUF1566 domain-containing protein [Hahella sp. HNIBRBA332]
MLLNINRLLFLLALGLPSAVVAALEECSSEVTPTSQFVLKGEEAYDTKTGLIWSRCSMGLIWREGAGCVGKVKISTLAGARHFAEQQGQGWRIPTIEELYSLVRRGCSEPAINAEVFPDVRDLGEGSPYWSQTQVEEVPILYYFVDFMTGDIDGHTERFPLALRLVRDKETLGN